MSLRSAEMVIDPNVLLLVKEESGRRIERRRKQVGLTQERLAVDVGIGVRWLREIEAGNPKSRIDDHLRCAHRLGLSTGHIFVPLMFMEHQMSFPRQFLTDDMADLERRCIRFIADYKMEALERQFGSVRRA